jgi:branched-chain amino acid transport system substrate-binding protein
VIEAYAHAAEQAASLETDKVRAALDSFKDVDLLVGPTTFTKDLHINLHRDMVIMEIQGGNNQYLETRAPKEVPQVEF